MARQDVRLICFIHPSVVVVVRLVGIDQRLKLISDERFVKSNRQGREFMHATEACQDYLFTVGFQL
ncbi:hypothetical protein GCM10009726_36350 [Nocardioides furvisabuli]|uniref:Uncharacterized protein n=1 Tax=Nocardioides furvisabuli TaxID=375542 RepID=A0ABP5JGM9_9ACTN